MTGDYSSTVYYHCFIGHAASLSQTKTTLFSLFIVTASLRADAQRSDLSSFRYSYLYIISLGCPMSLCAWKRL